MARKNPAEEPVSAAVVKDPRNIDEVLRELETVVSQLERGELPLEQALAHFERGVHLAKEGEHLLTAVEHRVEQLLEGRDEPVPFTEGQRDG